MKKTLISALTVLALLFTLAGCQSKEETVEINGEETLINLLNEVKYGSVLTEMGEKAPLYFSDLPEGSEVKLYMGNGYVADEAAMIKIPKSKDSKKVGLAVENHLGEIKNQFEKYIPEEVIKIENAVVKQHGNYFFICITEDRETAEKVLENPVTGEESKDKEKSAYPVIKSKSGEIHDYKNGVVRVDSSAYELYTYVDSAAQKYADTVNRAAENLKGISKVYVMPIPTAVGVIFPDDLKDKVDSDTNQGECIEKINSKLSDDVTSINVYANLMKHRDEYIYFRTDHHWNGKGAYYAYESFCKAKNITPITMGEREKIDFDGFLGELYWKGSGEDKLLKESVDTVNAYYPKSENAAMKYTDSKGEVIPWKIIYDVSNWSSSSKYSTFAGADSSIAYFENPDVKDDSVCIIVKESFGNALLPYLVDHYSKIYEIDYRYWNGNLTEFAKEHNADEILFANNLTMIHTNYLIGKLSDIID